jgi:hypothetical protein
MMMPHASNPPDFTQGAPDAEDGTLQVPPAPALPGVNDQVEQPEQPVAEGDRGKLTLEG